LQSQLQVTPEKDPVLAPRNDPHPTSATKPAAPKFVLTPKVILTSKAVLTPKDTSARSKSPVVVPAQTAATPIVSKEVADEAMASPVMIQSLRSNSKDFARRTSYEKASRASYDEPQMLKLAAENGGAFYSCLIADSLSFYRFN
jgi:hypothetical protein